MSNSSLASVFIPAKHYTKGRDGRYIQMITIHHMAGVLTAEQCGRVFQGNRKASAHYGVGKNAEIAQYVDESNTAWANSNWDSNCKAVTIETSNDSTGGEWHVSDAVLDQLIRLVADIAKRNNLGTLVKGKNVTWHRMYCATTCPGEYLLSKMDYICEQANKINQGEEPEPSKEEFNVAKTYHNGSTPENIYADTNLTKKIGSLDKYETCECLDIVNGRYLVKYRVNGTNNYKCGFAKYDGRCASIKKEINYE